VPGGAEDRSYWDISRLVRHASPSVWKTPDPLNFHPQRRERRASALSIRPFRRLWIATSLSSLGDWLTWSRFCVAGVRPGRSGAAPHTSSVAGCGCPRCCPPLCSAAGLRGRGPAGTAASTWIIADVLRAVLVTGPSPLQTCPIHAPTPDLGLWCSSGGVRVAVPGPPGKDASVPNLVPPYRLKANQYSCSPRSARPGGR